jgi:hypothetical protein
MNNRLIDDASKQDASGLTCEGAPKGDGVAAPPNEKPPAAGLAACNGNNSAEQAGILWMMVQLQYQVIKQPQRRQTRSRQLPAWLPARTTRERKQIAGIWSTARVIS